MLYSVSPACTTCTIGVGVGRGVGVKVLVGVAVGVCVGGSVAVALGVRVGVEVGVKVYVGALDTRVGVVSLPGLERAATRGCTARYARLPTIATAAISTVVSPPIHTLDRDLGLGEVLGGIGSGAPVCCGSARAVSVPCGSTRATPRVACSKAARLRSV